MALFVTAGIILTSVEVNKLFVVIAAVGNSVIGVLAMEKITVLVEIIVLCSFSLSVDGAGISVKVAGIDTVSVVAGIDVISVITGVDTISIVGGIDATSVVARIDALAVVARIEVVVDIRVPEKKGVPPDYILDFVP